MAEHEGHLFARIAKRLDEMLRRSQEGLNGVGLSCCIARKALDLAVNRGQPGCDITVRGAVVSVPAGAPRSPGSSKAWVSTATSAVQLLRDGTLRGGTLRAYCQPSIRGEE
jgi:hypothetical protein